MTGRRLVAASESAPAGADPSQARAAGAVSEASHVEQAREALVLAFGVPNPEAHALAERQRRVQQGQRQYGRATHRHWTRTHRRKVAKAAKIARRANRS